MLDSWLRFLAMYTPILGALIIWRGGEKLVRFQRRLAGGIFCIMGVAALLLFFLNRYYACIFATEKSNCLFDGAATISLIVLHLVLIRGCIRMRAENNGEDLILMLLLSSAWAGVGLGKNLFVILLALYLFFFVLHRWYRKIGYKGGFMKFRDDDD